MAHVCRLFKEQGTSGGVHILLKQPQSVLPWGVYRGPVAASVNEGARKFNTHFAILPGGAPSPWQRSQHRK